MAAGLDGSRLPEDATGPSRPATVEDYDTLDSANREKWLWYLPWKDLPPEAVGGLGERINDWLANHHVDRWGFDENFGDINLPVFHRTGWYDRLVRTVDMFKGMRESGATAQARRNQRLIVGPWSHTSDLNRRVGQVDFGSEAEIDYFSLIVPWFDHGLKGESDGVCTARPSGCS